VHRSGPPAVLRTRPGRRWSFSPPFSAKKQRPRGEVGAEAPGDPPPLLDEEGGLIRVLARMSGAPVSRASELAWLS